ncbi:MAG: permease, partial [Nitrospirota bacterium]
MLKVISQYITYSLLKLEHGSHLADAVYFFIYDTIKIFLLLSVIIFAVSIIRSFFPPEKTKQILSHKKEFIGNILAALLGIVTPFCSCSAVPLFIGFVEAGIPLGVTFSFLISSPMVNEVAIVLLFGLFGWKVTAIYIGAGLLVAIFGGLVIGKL